MPKTALLCPPTYFDVLDMKNPYMLGESPVDKQKARAQWEALRRALETAGVQIETIEAVPGLEDMVFAANQVFVGYHEKIGKFIVPSNMRFSSRQREVAYYVEWFRARDYKVIEVDFGDEYLEGSGDLIWHPDRSRIYAGHAFRSTIGGIWHLEEAMQKLGIPVIALELIDERFYHLDTCFCPLNDDAVLIFPGAFAQASLDELHGYWQRVHEISEEEAAGFIANGIVANGHFLTPRVTGNLEKILAQEKLKPLVVETSEYEKSGGSCFCMKNFID
jgi:N-dimethylarginine dimethylaminohydrolase